MRIEEKKTTILYADEGKVLRNKRTGAIVADSQTPISLGYDYYELGIGLREPYLPTPDDFEEIEGSMEHPPVIDQSWRLSQIARKLDEEKWAFKTLGLTAEQMIQHKAFAPKWCDDFKDGDTMPKGEKFVFEGKLYASLQDHTVQKSLTPAKAAAKGLYIEVTPDYVEEVVVNE